MAWWYTALEPSGLAADVGGLALRCFTSRLGKMWAWVKMKPPENRRFLSMLPSTSVLFWVPIFYLLPCVGKMRGENVSGPPCWTLF